MNASEAAQLLTVAAAFDQRTISREDAIAWADVLRSVDLEDAVAAVKQHYTNSTTRVMPADIFRGVRALRGDRVARVVESVPDADPDDPAAYITALRAGRRRAGGTRGLPQLPRMFRQMPKVTPAELEGGQR